TLMLTQDQRGTGYARDVALTATDKPRADIGAYEIPDAVRVLSYQEYCDNPMGGSVVSRSMVNDIKVVFNQTVQLPADLTTALTLERKHAPSFDTDEQTDTGLVYISVSYADGPGIVTMTFPAQLPSPAGSYVVHGVQANGQTNGFSIPDGTYQLKAFQNTVV